MLSSVYSVCTRGLWQSWHQDVTSCQKLIKEMWWAPIDLIRSAQLLAGTGRVAVKWVSVRAGAKGESLVQHERGAGIGYSTLSGCRSAAEWEQQRPSTFTRVQSRKMLFIDVNNGLTLKHISRYGYKNGFFYLPAGRALTNPGEASVNCWYLNCFQIRSIICFKLLNDEDYGRYCRRDLLWHGSI